MLKSTLSVFLLQCFLLEISAFSLFGMKQERFICPSDGFFPIDDQCTAEYYACVGGVAYLQSCPGTNNVFDPLISKCVPYESASCRTAATTSTPRTTSISSTARTTTIPSGSTFTCPTLEGFYAIPNTCGSDYYVCVSGSPYISTCPEGSIFDPVTLVCTSVDQASCQSVFTCPSSDGFYPVPGTCGNSYYSCVGGTAYLVNCPGNAVFDPATNNCVLEENASCITTTTTPRTTTPITTPTTTPTTTTTTTTTTTPKPTTPIPFVCPGPAGQYPYPGSCTLYYVCSSEGNYIVASCPVGQVFDPSTQYCEDPLDVSECQFDPILFLRDLRFVGITGSPLA